MTGVLARVHWRKRGETATRTTDLRSYVQPVVSEPRPTVFAAQPANIAGGPTLVHGARFSEDAVVETAGVVRPTTFLSTSQLLATVPAHAIGNVALRVIQASGTSNTVDLAYTSDVAPAPTIVSATSVGAAGGTSTITGTDFTADVVITSSAFTAGATTFVDATTVTVVVPAHAAGSYPLTATQSSGTHTLAGALTILPLPVVSSATSVTDVGGTTTVTGSNFTNPAVVWTDGVARSTTYGSATSLTATVPAHAAGTVNLYVAQASGNSNTISLTYTASLIDPSTLNLSGWWEQGMGADYAPAGSPPWQGLASAGASGSRTQINFGSAPWNTQPIVGAAVGSTNSLRYDTDLRDLKANATTPNFFSASAFTIGGLIKLDATVGALSGVSTGQAIFYSTYLNILGGQTGGLGRLNLHTVSSVDNYALSPTFPLGTWVTFFARLSAGVLSVRINKVSGSITSGVANVNAAWSGSTPRHAHASNGSSIRDELANLWAPTALSDSICDQLHDRWKARFPSAGLP